MHNRDFTSILLVEDNPGDACLLRVMIEEQRPSRTSLVHVETMTAAKAFLAAHTVDLILLDLGLPDAQGIDAVQQVRAAAPRASIVVLTGLEDVTLAARAIRAGAQDYLLKGHIETVGLALALGQAMERQATETAGGAERDRAQVTLNCIGQAVACTDLAGGITFLNRAAEELTGWTRSEARGRPAAEVLRLLNADTRLAIQAGGAPLESGDEAMQPAQCVLVRRDGAEFAVDHTVAPIHDSAGSVVGAVSAFRDVRLERAVALQLDHFAKHDFLTGLPNRMLLLDRAEQAITVARRHQRCVGLLFLDLDGFKQVNDTFGHQVGDKLLQSVAGRLLDCVRESDTVSRQGGDEFVVLLSEVDSSDAVAAIARRMIASVNQPHLIDGDALRVSASIGASVYPLDGPDAATLIKHADVAMYQAKHGGFAGFQFYHASMATPLSIPRIAS
jgi:diguanylate cyclase (GGDEF)-like protein/PAS domain S-box-containing protein